MHVKRGKRKEDHAKALCWSNTCLDSSKGPEFVARIPESISLRWMTKMICTLRFRHRRFEASFWRCPSTTC